MDKRRFPDEFRLKPGDRVGLIACSNGLSPDRQGEIQALVSLLREWGLEPVCSPCLYAREGGAFSGSGNERAQALLDFYRDDAILGIFDLSGGDLANRVLPFLDYGVLARPPKPFFGYSDLTALLNGIYAQTGLPGGLYQLRNLLGPAGEPQRRAFFQSFFDGTGDLLDFPFSFLQGDAMEGVVAGGNLRCLLKLAGTPYWPDLTGKLLFLEARSGLVPQLSTMLEQLSQLGAFRQAAGILLGTFTQMEREAAHPRAEALLLPYLPKNLPVAKTPAIGHGPDSKCLLIGKKLLLSKKEGLAICP